MKSYSMDLRLRVLEACDSGMGTAEVAETYSVSEAWVRRLKQRRRESGSIEPKRQARYGPTPVLEPHRERLSQLVQEHPDRTSREYRDLLGVSIGVNTVWRALRGLGLTFKKR